MKNYNIIMLAIIIFIIFYLLYLEYLCKEEILDEKHIIKNYDSNIIDYLYNLNKKDKLLLKEFILSLTKENTKRKEKRKLHSLIINGILVSAGIVVLDNLEFPNYVQYPIISSIISILTPY